MLLTVNDVLLDACIILFIVHITHDNHRTVCYWPLAELVLEYTQFVLCFTLFERLAFTISTVVDRFSLLLSSFWRLFHSIRK